MISLACARQPVTLVKEPIFVLGCDEYFKKMTVERDQFYWTYFIHSFHGKKICLERCKMESFIKVHMESNHHPHILITACGTTPAQLMALA